MSQLHAVLAVLPSKKNAASAIAAETVQTFARKPDHFIEVRKSYQPLKEGGETLPEDFAPMSTTVGEKLRHFASVFGPWVDAQYQVDITNTQASADLEIDGVVIAKDVPGTALLQFKKTVKGIREVYASIPTLDPKYSWEEDGQKGTGVYKANDIETNRTEKIIQPQVLAPATEKHAAQVEKVVKDVMIGVYTAKRWSGELSPKQKAELLHRVDLLGQAVDRALAEANRAEHSIDKVSGKVFEFLHGDLPLTRG